MSREMNSLEGLWRNNVVRIECVDVGDCIEELQRGVKHRLKVFDGKCLITQSQTPDPEDVLAFIGPVHHLSTH